MANLRSQFSYKKIFSAVQDITLNSDRPDAFLETICDFVGATSSTLWSNNVSSLPKNKFVLIGCYNRGDISDKKGIQYIDIKKREIISAKALYRNKVIRGRVGEEPFNERWLEKKYTKSLPKLGVSYIAIVPVEDRLGRPVSILSLYFKKEPKNLPNDILLGISGIISATIEAIEDNLRSSRLERRKDRHEIMYHTRIISAKFHKISNDINLLRDGKQDFKNVSKRAKDISSSLRVLRQSYTSSSFKERVSDRCRHTEYLNLYESVQEAISKTINVQKRPDDLTSGEINISRSAYVLFHPDDLSMLITQFYSNAAKHSVIGSVVRTKLEEGVDDDCYYLTIRNDVDGGMADDLSQIWQYEFRGEYAEKRKIEGEGLGLGMAKDICDVYGISAKADYEEENLQHTKVFCMSLQIPKGIIDEERAN